jgi:hypothetical protein
VEYIPFFDGEVEIRQSKKSDVDYLKDNLREQDIEELALMGIQSKEEVNNSILFGFESPESTCYTMEFKGNIVAMFGVVPNDEDETSATLWMLSTNEVRKFPKRFLKLAKRYVEGFKSEYDTLWNFIHPSNKLSLKLVELLGAQFRWSEKGEFNSPKTGEPFFLFLI